LARKYLISLAAFQIVVLQEKLLPHAYLTKS
jgi:hypothetical protein